MLLAFIFNVKAVDSTKVKPIRAIIEVGYRRSITGVNYIKDLNPSVTYNNGPQNKYYTSDGNYASLNLSLNLNPKNQKRQLYFTVGGNYADFKFYHQKNEFYSGGHGSGSNFSCSPNTFKYTVRLFTGEMGLNYLWWRGNFLIDQKIGFSVTFIQNDKRKYSYDETASSWGYLTDPAYVTASNPSGYYLAESISTQTIVDGERSYYFNDYFTPYYSLGFGYRIKRVVPFVSGQLSMFEMIFWQPFMKYQAGVKILF